jgi:hypothetical protein
MSPKEPLAAERKKTRCERSMMNNGDPEEVAEKEVNMDNGQT